MKKKVTCSRGHVFYKSSDCLVCPRCWSGFYRKQSQADFPAGLAAPALRALLGAKIHSIAGLARFTESEILELHGMGKSAIEKLRLALNAKGLSFKTSSGKKSSSASRGARKPARTNRRLT